MSGEIIVYTFRRGDEEEDWGGFQTQNHDEAVNYAKQHKLLVMENVYEWQEALPAEDFRGDTSQCIDHPVEDP